MAEGKVPVRESVGAALRHVREQIGPIAAVAAAAALALTLINILSLSSPGLGLLLAVVPGLIASVAYASFTRGALSGAAPFSGGLALDGLRLWASMLIVGFFLLIVIIVGIVIFAILISPRYGEAIQQMQGDQVATMTLMERIVAENPGMILGFALAYGLIWMMLTSRLYLAAPATVEQNRILTFETWKWTKGNMWRIIGARAMLLFPAYVAVSAVAYLVAGGFGLNVMDPASIQSFAESNLPLYAVFNLATSWLQLALYSALEAGLSAYLYKGLKPAEAITPT